jgi:hypothetical protein
MSDRELFELQEEIETLKAELAAVKRDSAIQSRGVLRHLLASPRGRLVLVVAVVAIPLAAYATQISVPYTFVNGTPADATEVNANFSTLVSESNAQDSRLAALESQIATNTTNINTNTSQLAINTPAIAAKVADIGALFSDVGTNMSDITTNAGDIATNTANNRDEHGPACHQHARHRRQHHTSYGGLLAGGANTVSGPSSSASGGYGNTASGDQASVSGGNGRSAAGADDWAAGTLWEDN